MLVIGLQKRKRSLQGVIMKDNFGKEKTLIVIGSSLILIGVLLNEWIVAALFCPDGVLSTFLYRIVVWFFDISLVSIGALLLIYRKSTRISRKTFIFPAITLILITTILEVGLQLLTVIFPKIDALLSEIPRNVYDEKLVHRPNPAYPGHDLNGFRNKSVPKKADIVAMGDSQTYGTNVRVDQAWPQQLQKLGNIKVYNISSGGYGPVHSLILLDEALKFKPRLLIEALYAGNDLYDSYYLVYDKNQLPDMKTSDEKVIRDIYEAENIESLGDRAQRMLSNQTKQTKTQDSEHDSSLTKYFSENCKLYRVFSTLNSLCNYYMSLNSTWELEKKYAQEDKTYFLPFESERFRTIFTPVRRLCALDLNDIRILEGHRLSLEAIRFMNERTRIANIDFIVLLIPTKELVFKSVVYETQQSMPDEYNTLIDNEELFWRRTKAYLEDQGIGYIDSLPVLRGCFRSGVQPYRITKDGHPNPAGHHAIAELVLSTLRSRDHTALK